MSEHEKKTLEEKILRLEHKIDEQDKCGQWKNKVIKGAKLKD